MNLQMNTDFGSVTSKNDFTKNIFLRMMSVVSYIFPTLFLEEFVIKKQPNDGYAFIFVV